MQLHVTNCRSPRFLHFFAKALLLFYYGFLDIGRDRMIQRMKYCAHLGDDAGDIHYRRDPFSAMLNCFPDDSQLDAEPAKMSRLPALREDEQGVYSADTSKFGGAKV